MPLLDLHRLTVRVTQLLALVDIFDWDASPDIIIQVMSVPRALLHTVLGPDELHLRLTLHGCHAEVILTARVRPISLSKRVEWPGSACPANRRHTTKAPQLGEGYFVASTSECFEAAAGGSTTMLLLATTFNACKLMPAAL